MTHLGQAPVTVVRARENYTPAVSLIERIRSFWKPAAAPDHPLDARERDEDRTATAYDERSRVTEEFVGDDFDPDEGER